MKKPHACTGEPLSGKASARLAQPRIKIREFLAYWILADFLHTKLRHFLWHVYELSETNFIVFK